MAVAERISSLPAELINSGSPVGIVRSVAEIGIPPRPEIGYKQTVGEVISALWLGKINPTWIEIGDCCGGQVQVRHWDEASNDWQREFDSTFAWTHVGKDKPLGFRGIFFVHQDKLSMAGEAGRSLGGSRVKVYAGWNHDQPVLEATIGRKVPYKVGQFDDPTDPAVREIARSSKTIAIVYCGPPGCEGSGCSQRIVYYAWASLP